MKELDNIDVTPLQIRDFAVSLKWSLVKEALKDGLFVLNAPDASGVQVSFPKSEDDSQYFDIARLALLRLSEYHKTPIGVIVNAIREVNDDVLSLRYYSDSKNVNSISFEEALESFNSARQMLLSAASSVVNPSVYHPRLNRTEPQELIKKARFRHTQEGSFILNISLPFELETLATPTLFEENDTDKPLSRKTLENANQSALSIMSAVDEDNIDEFFALQSADPAPIVSFNYCDALVKLYDDERELPFELSFHWSKASLQHLAPPTFQNTIRFPYSHRSKIEIVRDYFKPKQSNILEGRFAATVETLDGSLDDNNQRFGSVTLSVLYENEILKTKAELNSEQYLKAVDAHKNGGSYIFVEGTIERKKNVGTFKHILNLEKG